jgi:hypothetical protein
MKNILDTFDPYAMVNPKTYDDVVALLAEANRRNGNF